MKESQFFTSKEGAFRAWKLPLFPTAVYCCRLIQTQLQIFSPVETTITQKRWLRKSFNSHNAISRCTSNSLAFF